MDRVEVEEDRTALPLMLLETSPADAPIAIPAPRRIDGRAKRPLGRWWFRLIGMLALLGLAAGGFWWVSLPPSIAVVRAHRGQAIQAVYATGTVEPTVMVPLAARSAARLVALDVDEGSIVTKGQVLARLENDDLRHAVEVASAEERYAKAELDRQAKLVERQVSARSAYDRARADWEKARATTAKAVSEAGFLELIAPADGLVIRRDGEIGQLIGANQTVFWLSCCAPLRIAAEVDEEDIAQVRPGQAVLIRSDAFPGQILRGSVQSVTAKGDPVARSYRVRVSLPQDTPLMIGMTTETNIILRRDDNALLLPASAVQQDSVWQVTDGRVSRRNVTVGAKGATEIEILGGIGENDDIVGAPPAGMQPGEKVRALTSKIGR